VEQKRWEISTREINLKCRLLSAALGSNSHFRSTRRGGGGGGGAAEKRFDGSIKSYDNGVY